MDRIGLVIAIALGWTASTGCKSTRFDPNSPGDLKPALLVGPEANAKAAPPVELPAKDSARLCLRTAQEFEKTFARTGQDQDLQNAIQLFEKARSNAPSTAKTASRRLAVLYDKAGEFQKASAEYEALLLASPKDVELLADLGYSYYCRGDWVNAESYLQQAIQLDPSNKRAWSNLGLARAQLQKWDESFQAFCQAVRPADAHCNLAFVLAAQGKGEEAKAQYRQALALDPGLRLAQVALGQLENPQPRGAAGGTSKSKERFDPVLAAAQVPNIAEIEARMRMAAASSTAAEPSADAKTPKE